MGAEKDRHVNTNLVVVEIDYFASDSGHDEIHSEYFTFFSFNIEFF